MIADVDRIVEAAKSASLRLTPPELALSPEPFRRSDGTTLFQPRHSISRRWNRELDRARRNRFVGVYKGPDGKKQYTKAYVSKLVASRLPRMLSPTFVEASGSMRPGSRAWR